MIGGMSDVPPPLPMPNRVPEPPPLAGEAPVIFCAAGQFSGRDETRRFSLGELLAWVVIVGLVGLTMYRVQINRQVGGALRDGNGYQMELMARYVVGAKAAFGAAGAGNSKELRASFEQSVKSPRDEVRAAVVAGEFAGVVETTRRLRELWDKYPELRREVEVLDLLSRQQPLANDGDREAIQDRYGWIADLAETLGRPESDPQRVAVLSGAMRTMAAMAGVAVLILAALGVGAVLLVSAVVQKVRGKLQPAFQRGRTHRGMYAEAFALFMVVYVGGSAGLAALGLRGLWGTLVLPMAFGVALVWPRVRGQSAAEWRSALGLTWGRGLMREVWTGIGGYLAGVPIVMVGFVMTMLLMKVSGAQPAHPITQELTGPAWAKVMVFLLAAVWAPISEELVFRGALLASLRQRMGVMLAAVIGAVLFAGIHPQGWAAIPVLASLAIVFAWMREWRQSIIGPMVAHGLHNGATVLLAILMIG